MKNFFSSWQRVALVATFLALVIAVMFAIRYRIQKYNEEFHGVIKAITYGEKDFVEIVVNNKKYTFGPVNNKFIEKVNINDSISKTKGSEKYIIVKKGNVVLEF